MNYWKVKNICANTVRLVVTVGPAHSLGVMLRPNQSVMCTPQRTPSMDAQIRRRFVEVEKDFKNDLYDLELGKVYSEEEINNKKMHKAEVDAGQYVQKKDETK